MNREVWGPRFWTIFHTMAECVGCQSNKIMANDEAEAWILLLKSQPFVMPCAVCKNHLVIYLRLHSLDKLRTIYGEERYIWLKSWLYQLHEHVNRNKNVEGHVSTGNTGNTVVPCVTIENLATLYPRRKLDPEFSACCGMFQKAFELQKLKPDDVHRWKLALSRLRKLYGI